MKNHLFKVKTNYASPMAKGFSELSVVMISRNEEKAIAKVNNSDKVVEDSMKLDIRINSSDFTSS